MERLTRVFAETTHGTKGYESVNEIKVDTESIHNLSEIITTLGKIEDVLAKYEIENAEDLNKFIHHKDCQIEKWKQDYENCSKLEKLMSKEHQYCLDNWRACEQELAELKQKAIVPKFKVGQEIYVIDDYFRVTSAIIERITICRENSISEVETSYVHYLANLGEKYEWDERYLILDGEDISLTKEEAEQKLAEIKGE